VQRFVLALALVACGNAKQSAGDGSGSNGSATRTSPPDAPPVATAAEREQLFLGVPTAKAATKTIDQLAAIPHVAGTRGAGEIGAQLVATLGRLGWRTGEARYDVYLPQPKRVAVTLAGQALEATAIPFSAGATATGPLVDADATPPPYAGKVVVVRAGGASIAALQRAGAVAVIVHGGALATALDPSHYTGDPLTPGAPAAPDAKRLAPADAKVLPAIPVVAVADGKALLAAIGKPVEVTTVLDGESRPIRNILAFFPGKSEQAIVVGAHYDGTELGPAALIEIARGFTALQRAGWRPQRTIILAFWDAGELGAIGSTEWVEEQIEMLLQHGVAYLDVGGAGEPRLATRGNPALHALAKDCAAAAGHALVVEDGALAGDATAFAQHAGVASLAWTHQDPAQLARVVGLCALRLAELDHLPLRYSATAAMLREAQGGNDRLARAIDALDSAARGAEAATPGPLCNQALAIAERGFLSPDGVDGRAWHRHLAFGATLVPELVAATEPIARKAAIDRLVGAIERVTTTLAACR